MVRTCRVCGVSKPAETDYYAHKRTGYDTRCKECVKSSRRKPRECMHCGVSYVHTGSSGSRRKLCDDCTRVVKWCSICQQHKMIDEFYEFNPYCRPCASGFNRSYKYGVPVEWYQEAYERQRGNCAACGEHFESLCVDHDHSTGAVRALLCDGCNKGIGCFRESVDAMAGAMAYLLSYRDVLAEQNGAGRG